MPVQERVKVQDVLWDLARELRLCDAVRPASADGMQSEIRGRKFRSHRLVLINADGALSSARGRTHQWGGRNPIFTPPWKKAGLVAWPEATVVIEKDEHGF